MRPRSLALLVIVALVVAPLSGCLSVKTKETRAPEGTVGGAVSVTVYENDGARRASRPGPAGIVGELERREGGRWVPVFRSLDPVWTVAGLAPGAYRIRFPAMLDEAGNVVRRDDDAEELRVREGRVTQARVVLEHVNTLAVAAGVAAVVIAAELLDEFLQDNDLPAPPAPPDELLEALFYVSIDLALAGWRGVADGLPPTVTSHFPYDGALVAARRPRVVFALSEPLDPTDLEADAVTVLGERSGLVPGIVSYDAEHWWIVWEPSADLEADDTFHVTLAAGAYEDQAGNEFDRPVSFAFETAR